MTADILPSAVDCRKKSAEMEAEKAAVLTGIIASASDPNTSKDPS